ncbi:Na(+)-translocating NADH-quinone reductase subunit C [Thiohalocapsa halophila]|uniref:Na(+)-translocating NADH-quinone reductase subunit C n=1 Tax=Thiohalocapsa halophila TaxID=69359 RepID=A0ABS1CNE4_9GAMM|nr:Na(+)-translocating NADH-quinone reductase subunit C [Thiohalocapsa halophila]MBK1633359.1 Na(+)-translocating NADH-quinone reductase subunit C [Thiohalocapsa halophila]
MSNAVLARLRAVFALPNDDPRKTLAVAVALCLACSVVVSATAVTLRPLQERNAALELKREVVKVAGLDDPGVSLSQAFEQIEPRLVDLETGELLADADASTYSYRDAAQDPDQSKALAQDPAGIRRRPDRMPVYLVRNDGALATIVLPVYGQGLWSTMHGLLALAPDGRTVKGLTFYEQRETAGLGSEVASPKWLGQWAGKTVIGPDGKPVIEVVKGSVDPKAPNAERKVDGLSGATLTSNGVENLMDFWLGEQGYGGFLARLGELGR